jgi:hypothetical protein
MLVLVLCPQAYLVLYIAADALLYGQLYVVILQVAHTEALRPVDFYVLTYAFPSSLVYTYFQTLSIFILTFAKNYEIISGKTMRSL